MTLLTIAQAAADEVQINRPGSVVGNSDPDAQRFLRFANKAGEWLSRQYDWQALRKEQTFTSTATETQAGALPSDFGRFVTETFWNRTQYRLVTGPVSSVQWQGRRASANPDTPEFFSYRGGTILVSPTPKAGDTYAFEYVSNEWTQGAGGGATASTFAADTDVSLIDEELVTLGVIFEWLQSEGQPIQVAAAQYQRRLRDLVRQERSSTGKLATGDIFARGSRRFDGTPTPYANSEFGI